ncbi:MAG: type II toxin-antitoxin system HipA family toxin, partial [Bdellovibrionales bacterium]|nr:type II toxin-antitoxin system HipA family toxin [Bdellovibrionales bacterium]
FAAPARGKEIFSFEYDQSWLKSGQARNLDPKLALVAGPQYPNPDHPNFGLFLDSSPDRWGRTLMDRREAQRARAEKRTRRNLLESDYLLGVFDGHRMGALRFKLDKDGAFLDDDADLASPPWAKLRELEHASLQLEQDRAEDQKEYMQWLKMLIAPGGSLGGARPKASVVDEKCALWIAKFPSRRDEINVGAWEYVVHLLAVQAGVETADAQIKRFSGCHDTFLTKRFDRQKDKRIHFASAMTLLEKKDGAGADDGSSYMELVEFLVRYGAQVNRDLQQLWRRIVFNICVSNLDDHLRNHGFILTKSGWVLSPAYDMNPSVEGEGLKLNISDKDNAQDVALALDVAEIFRLKNGAAKKIIKEVTGVVKQWKKVSEKFVPKKEISKMERAFRVADEYK